jgi:transcriptional regulator with XRE-family HTH domain
LAVKPVPVGPREVALGAAFQLARKKRRLSLRRLARILHVSVNTLRWHEAGAVMFRTGTIVRAAEVMDVPPVVLLIDDPDEPKWPPFSHA